MRNEMAALFAAAGVWAGCAEREPAEPFVASATLTLSPELASAAPSAVRFERVRVTVRDDAGGRVRISLDSAVAPGSSPADLTIDVPLDRDGATAIRASIELVRGADGVEWSGASAALDLRPGRTVTVPLSLFRGPLDNLAVTGVALPDSLHLLGPGDSLVISADVSTDGQGLGRVFWTSLADSIVTVQPLDERSARVTTLRPGSARMVAEAGPRADTTLLRVADAASSPR